MADNWTPPSDAEVVDWTPPSDAQTTDEPVKKKVVTTPSESTSQDGAKVLSDVSEQFRKAGTQGEKPLSESGTSPKKLVEDTPTYEDKQSLSTTDIANEKKRLEKMPTSESMLLESGTINAISSDIVRNKNISEIASQDPNVLKLNSLILERDKAIQANEGQKVADLSSEIESLKKAPADNPIDLQQQLQQHNLQYQGAPQDTPQEVSGFKPQTLNDRLVANKAKPVKTVGELHDLSNEAQKKVSELEPELDKIKIPFDEQVAQLRKENRFKSTEENGVRKLEGIADAPEAFVMGARNTFKDGLGMLKQVFGTKEDRQNYSDQRALEDGVLFPTETKGGWTSGAEMAGGVAPYIATGALGGETILGQILSNGLTMGATGIGSAYHQEYQKQKALGLSKDDADKVALEKSAFHGGTQAVLGGSLPFLGGASKSILMHPKDLKLLEQFAEESALGKPYAYNAKNIKASLKGFASEMGGIQTAFAGEHIANNAFDKYVLGDKKKNLLEGTADVIMQGSLLHLGMHVLPSVPKAIKDIYDVNFSKRYPSIQQAVDMAMQEGKITKEQADAITVPLRQKYVIYNAMPEGLTAEQMVSIKPETEQILELSKKEPSAVENPEITKDRIAQLQKTIAEKLGTPLTEKEQKAYEKLLERQKPIKSESGKEITLELFPSEKAELKHYEKRIKTAEDIEFKLAEEKKVAEAEAPLTNVGVEEGSGGVGGDVEIKNEGKADAPTKESVTERLSINNPFYKKVEDALVKLGLIEKYNAETGTGDVVGGYAQQTSDGGFSVGKMLFSQDGSISYFNGDVKVSFDKNGNVISENTKEAKQKANVLAIESKKESIDNLEKTRDSEAFKYKEVTETDTLGNKKKVKRLKTEQELKDSTDKINAAIDKAKAELSNFEQSLKETTNAETPTTTKESNVVEGSGGVGGEKTYADFISNGRLNEISDKFKSKTFDELKTLLADQKDKFDRKVKMGQKDQQLRQVVWDLQELVSAHEKANGHNSNLSQKDTKFATENTPKDDGFDYVRNKFSQEGVGGKRLSDKESNILNKEVDKLIDRAEKENGVKRNELKQATWKTNDGYTVTDFFENGRGGTRIITPKGEEINLFDNKYKGESGRDISYFSKAHEPFKATEQSLKETTKAEPIVSEKPVVANKEAEPETLKTEIPKEVINKFKSLNEPQNEGKNGGTDGINTGKSKDGESGNVGKAKTKKADTSSKDSNAESNEGSEKKKGLKGKGNRIVAKIKGALKHPDYIRALAHEVTDVKDIVLQAFIGGQKINPSYIKELFANSQREWNVRIGLMDGKAPSIKELAHDMWEAHKMNFGEETKVSDQDYVNAIEAVIREHNGKKTMVDDINNRFISEDKIDEEHQKWNEYHRNHEQEVVDESAKILEGIDNEELGNKIANDKDDAEVEKYISEIELKAKQKVDEAIEKYKNEKGEIDSDAVDAIEKEYGKSVAEEVKQSDKFFPFQVEEPTSKRQEMVKDAVQSLIDNGFTKLEQIHQIAKEQLGEGYKKQEIDDAFNAIGKDKVSKEAEPITKGVIGRVSQWLNKTFGGKENVQILGSTKAIMDKAKSLMGGNSNGQPLFMHTPDGKVLGFTHDNKIYLNQEHLNPNTPVHEAGHIWTNWAKENQADHYEKGMDLVNGTDYLAKAKASEFYQKEALKLGKEGSKEYEDYMKHEALAMAIGDKGSKFVTEATRKSFTEWAKELWDSVAKAVGLKDTSAQELQNLTFDELTSRIAKDILSEAPSNYGTSRTIINENRAKLGLGEIGKGKGRTNQETRTVASEIYNQEQANELVDEVLSPDYNKFERTLSANELLVLEEHLRLQELSIKQK